MFPITAEAIKKYHEFMKHHLPETPTYYSPNLSTQYKADIYLKNEMMSPISSFKARGALASMMELEKIPVVTASTGNFGQGVAFGGDLLEMETHIFVPENPNLDKVRSIQNLGGIVHEGGKDLDEAKDLGKAWAEKNQFYFLEDGHEPAIMKGTATIATEILEQVPEPDYIIAPIGNGALINGITGCIRQERKNCKVIGVVAEEAPSMYDSFYQKKVVVSNRMTTFAEGIAVRVPVPSAVELMNELVDDVKLVSEKDMKKAILDLIELCHILVEPAASTVLAALNQIQPEIEGKKVVLVLTGSNISLDQLRELL